jgi:hypothetical protein
MSLIVEDGTGLTTSESYCSVAEADSYFSKRANADWDNLEVADKEACLRKATDYMVAAYRLRWKGQRTTATQALDWPRAGVVTDDQFFNGYYNIFQVDYHTIPKEVKSACAELALRASISPLSPDLSQKSVSESIGPIKVDYDPYSSQNPVYIQIDMMLQPFINANGNKNTFKLTRC